MSKDPSDLRKFFQDAVRQGRARARQNAGATSVSSFSSPGSLLDPRLVEAQQLAEPVDPLAVPLLNLNAGQLQEQAQVDGALRGQVPNAGQPQEQAQVDIGAGVGNIDIPPTTIQINGGDGALTQPLPCGKVESSNNENEQEERRLDPLLGNKASTYSEVCQAHQAEGLSADQMKEHWNNLRKASVPEDAAPDKQEVNASPDKKKVNASPDKQKVNASPDKQKVDAAPDKQKDDSDLVSQAVCWIAEANMGFHPEGGKKNFSQKKQVNIYKVKKRLQSLFSLTNVAYLGIAFFELPPWCEGSCPLDASIPRLNGEHQIPNLTFKSIETGLLAIYALRVWINFEIFIHQPHCTSWRWFKISCIFASFVSCWSDEPLNLHRLLRIPIFISFSGGLRKTLVRVIKSLPAIKMACLILLGVCLFFSWVGMVLFIFTSSSNAFPSLGKSMKHMYVTISTNSMPNIMINAITVSPALGLFYVAFLVISLYLVMNILLANIYGAYKDLLSESVISFYSARRKSVDMAFELLEEEEGGSDGIGYKALKPFLESLLGVPPSADGPDKTHTQEVFDVLDEDGSGMLDADEFRLVAEVLADPSLQVGGDAGGLCPFLTRYESSIGKFDDLCDYLSALAFGLTLWQTTCAAEAADLPHALHVMCYQHSVINSILFGISMSYAVELFVEILMSGVLGFLRSDPFQNYFDLITVSALAPLECCLFLHGGIGEGLGILSHAPCRILMLLRGVRCLRCLHKLPGPREVLVTVYSGLQAFARVLLLLFCVCYFTAQIGMMSLGGEIRKDNKALLNTTYGDPSNDFWALNFNDMPSALYLLWSHLVGNNSNIWLDSFTTAFGDWVWFCFLAFDLVCNFAILNIVVALVIDCVMVPLPEQPEQEKTQEQIENEKTKCGKLIALFKGDKTEFVWPDREDQMRQMFSSPELEELDDTQKAKRASLREIFG